MTSNRHEPEEDGSGQIDRWNCPHVKRDPEIMTGAWCFEGTRLPVSTLFRCLAAGSAIPEFIEEFPSARADHVNAVLEFLADRVDATSTR